MKSDPHSPDPEEADRPGKGSAAGLVDIFAACIPERAELRRSNQKSRPAARNAAAIPPAAQMVLGAVFGVMTCLVGWLSFADYLSNRHVGSKADLIVGFLSSGFLTVVVVLSIQGALSIFLIWRKLKFAAIGVWLVYLPFMLFFLV